MSSADAGFDDVGDRSGWFRRSYRRSIARAGEVINRWLDSIFEEPLDIPDADTAMEALSDDTVGTAAPQAAFAAAALLTRWLSRARAASTAAAAGSGPMAWAARGSAIVLSASAVRIHKAVRLGLRDLSVLASYLMARARRDGAVLSKAAVRSMTVSIYVDPLRNIDRRNGGPQAGASVAKAMLHEAVSPVSHVERRRLAERRIAAIDRIDLHRLGER